MKNCRYFQFRHRRPKLYQRLEFVFFALGRIQECSFARFNSAYYALYHVFTGIVSNPCFQGIYFASSFDSQDGSGALTDLHAPKGHLCGSKVKIANIFVRSRSKMRREPALGTYGYFDATDRQAKVVFAPLPFFNFGQASPPPHPRKKEKKCFRAFFRRFRK